MTLFNCQGYCSKKLLFGPLAKTLDVGAVGIEDKASKREADGQEEFKIGSPPVAPDDHCGKNQSGQKRRNRDDTGDRETEYPEAERDECRNPGDRKKYPERRCHAFPPFELEPYRKAVPQDCADAQK